MLNPKSLAGIRIIAIIFLSVFLTACSTAVYDSEIKSFKSSTDSAIATVKNYATEAAKIRRLNNLHRKLKEKLLKNKKVQVTLSEACENIVNKTKTAREGKKCVVQLNGETFEDNEDKEKKHDLTLFNALAQYASNLEKAASAEGSGKVLKAIDELSDSVVSFAIARQTDDAKKKRVEGAVGPITALFQWFTGNYLNYKRWKALEEATDHVHPLLEKAGSNLNKLSTELHDDYALARLVEFRRQMKPNIVQISDSNDKVAELKDKVAELVALYAETYKVAHMVNSKPAGMFNAMVKAHDELKQAIADRTRQAETLYSALSEFKKTVDDVKKAFEKEGTK